MTTWALVRDGLIEAVGGLPPGAKRLDTGQWITPSEGQWTAEQAAVCGWLPVTDTPRPADTATTTWVNAVVLADGLPVIAWHEAPRASVDLAEQLDAQLDELMIGTLS